MKCSHIQMRMMDFEDAPLPLEEGTLQDLTGTLVV